MPTVPLKRGERIKIYEKKNGNECVTRIPNKKMNQFRLAILTLTVCYGQSPTRTVITAYRPQTRRSASNPLHHHQASSDEASPTTGFPKTGMIVEG